MSQTIELTLVQRADSVRAWGVTEDDDDDAELTWLPKSQCERGDTTVKRLKSGHETYVFEIPEWLAEQKGLI